MPNMQECIICRCTWNVRQLYSLRLDAVIKLKLPEKSIQMQKVEKKIVTVGELRILQFDPSFRQRTITTSSMNYLRINIRSWKQTFAIFLMKKENPRHARINIVQLRKRKHGPDTAGKKMIGQLLRGKLTLGHGEKNIIWSQHDN